MKRRGKFISILLAIVVLGVAWAVISFIKQRPLSARITIDAVPTGLSLTLNGKPAKQGVNKVIPGKYKVAGSRKGFEDYSITVSVAKGESKYAGLILFSNSPDTKNWYLDHLEDQQKKQGISSVSSDISSEQALKNVPLIRFLPYIEKNLVFRVDYGISKAHPGKGGNPAIYITTNGSQEAKDKALAWIDTKGFDTNKLEIIYKLYDGAPQTPLNDFGAGHE